MIDLLVVSAFEPELRALGVGLGAPLTLGARSLLAMPVGIGPLAAAAGCASAIAQWKPRRVLFGGTAGVFPSKESAFPIGKVALARATTFVDAAVLDGRAERPAPMSYELDAGAHAALSLPSANVAATSGITVEATLAACLDAAGYDLENLELASVACAAALRDVPCSALLGISNVVGPDGRAQWAANHIAAAASACRVLRDWLEAAPPERST